MKDKDRGVMRIPLCPNLLPSPLRLRIDALADTDANRLFTDGSKRSAYEADDWLKPPHKSCLQRVDERLMLTALGTICPSYSASNRAGRRPD